eukprot:184193_1
MPRTRKRHLEQRDGGRESWKEQDLSAKIKSLMSFVGRGQITDAKEMINSLSKSERKELAAAIPQGNTNMLNVITQTLSGHVKNKGSKENNNSKESIGELPGRPFTNRDLELDLYPYASEVWDMMASFGDTGRVRRTTFRCTCNVCPSKPPSGGSSGSNTRNKQKNEIHYPSAADGGSTSSCCECISPIKLLHNHVKEYIQELVNVALMQLENPKSFVTVKLLAELKPLEVKEYVSWSEAKKASQTKQPIASEAGSGEESTGEFSEVDDLGIDGIDEGGWRPSQNSRFMARKEFFDSRTAAMSQNVYSAFVLQRNAFFIKKSSNQGSKIEGDGDRRILKNHEAFKKWLKLPKRLRIRETVLEVLAFLAYDRIGMAVEEALRKKSGGRLKEIPGGYCINKEEISQAIVALPSVSDHPGSFIGKPLKEFRQGLKYSGDPKCWAKSVTQGGKIKGEAQHFVDISQLSQQATLLLSSLD